MDVDAVFQRQVRVVWVGGVWFLAAFMPFFLLPWHGSVANFVALAMMLAGAAGGVLGARAASPRARLWQHLFLTVPMALVLAALALAAWMADRQA